MEEKLLRIVEDYQAGNTTVVEPLTGELDAGDNAPSAHPVRVPADTRDRHRNEVRSVGHLQ